MKSTAPLLVVVFVGALTFVGGVYIFGYRPQGRADESPPPAMPSAATKAPAAEDRAERNHQQGEKAEQDNVSAKQASIKPESATVVDRQAARIVVPPAEAVEGKREREAKERRGRELQMRVEQDHRKAPAQRREAIALQAARQKFADDVRKATQEAAKEAEGYAHSYHAIFERRSYFAAAKVAFNASYSYLRAGDTENSKLWYGAGTRLRDSKALVSQPERDKLFALNRELQRSYVKFADERRKQLKALFPDQLRREYGKR